MQYAISITDLTAYADNVFIQMLVVPVIDKHHNFNPEPGSQTESATLLLCDETRAAAIVEIVRRKYKKHELRFYKSQTGNSWARI